MKLEKHALSKISIFLITFIFNWWNLIGVKHLGSATRKLVIWAKNFCFNIPRYVFPTTSSGAAYVGEPHDVERWESIPPFGLAQRPKSISFTTWSLSNSTFSGFRSLCAYPTLCRYATADTICRKKDLDSPSPSLFLSTVKAERLNSGTKLYDKFHRMYKRWK